MSVYERYDALRREARANGEREIERDIIDAIMDTPIMIAEMEYQAK